MASVLTTITDTVDAFFRRLGGQRLCEHCQQWSKKPYQSGGQFFCDKIHASIYFNKKQEALKTAVQKKLEQEKGYRG
jgi:hypothetical protein